MVRKIDDLGRVVLPVELRRLYGIQAGEPLAISVDGDAIVLRKLDEGCVFCGSASSLSLFRDRAVCAACATELGQRDAGGDEPTVTPDQQRNEI
jgi:transcriptional pleiotropic regulator of transition state genes